MNISKLLFSFSVSIWMTVQFAASADVTSATDSVAVCRAADHYHNLLRDLKACDDALTQSNQPDNIRAELLTGRGEALYFSGNTEESLNDFNEAIELNPNFLDAYYRRAWALIRADRTSEATNDANFIVNKNNKDDGAYFILGYIHQNFSNLKSLAFFEFQHALQINPKNLLARENLAFIYFNSDDQRPKAIEQFDILLSASDQEFAKVKLYPPPSNNDYDLRGIIRHHRIIALLDQNETSNLSTELNSIVENYPNVSDAYQLRAHYYDVVEDFKKALADSKRALQLNEKNGAALKWALNSLVRLNLITEGYKLANTSIDQYCGCIEGGTLFYYRGIFNEKLNKYDEALNDYEKSIALDPNNLRFILTQLSQSQYYSGGIDAPYIPEIRNALKACIVDPDCTA